MEMKRNEVEKKHNERKKKTITRRTTAVASGKRYEKIALTMMK